MNIYHSLAVLLLLATFCLGPGIAIAISFSQGNYQDASLIYIVGFIGGGGAIVLTILGNIKKQQDLKKERSYKPIPDYLQKPVTASPGHIASTRPQSLQQSINYEQKQAELHKGQVDEDIYILLRDTAAGNEQAIQKLVMIVNEKILNLKSFDTQIASALAKAFFSKNTTNQTRKLIWHIKDVVVVDYIYEYEIPLGYKDEDGNDTYINHVHEKFTFWEYLDHHCTRELEQFGIR